MNTNQPLMPPADIVDAWFNKQGAQEWELGPCAARLGGKAVTGPLKDHEIRELVNQLRDASVRFGGTQQLRERIADIIVPVLKGLPVAAAPGAQAATGLPKANGVSRNAEFPTSMLVFFDRELTDDEMRSLHEILAGRAALQQRQAPAPQVGRAALMEFIDKVCLGKSELISCAESAFYWFNKYLAKAEAAPAATSKDTLRKTNPAFAAHLDKCSAEVAAWPAWKGGQAAPAPTAEPMTYTVDGVVMSPLEYIDYLHTELSRVGQAEAAAPVATDEWQSGPVPEGSAFYAYHPSLIHADFNPWGVVEAAFDGEKVVGAVWNGCQDCWDTVPIEVELWKHISGPYLASPAAHPVSTGAGEAEAQMIVDAARYRWLRVNNIVANVRFHFASGESPYLYAEELDAAIDHNMGYNPLAAHPSAEGAKPLTITLQRGTNQQEISRLGWLQARVGPVPTYRDNTVLPTYKLKPVYYTVKDEVREAWGSYPLMSLEELLSHTSGD